MLVDEKDLEISIAASGGPGGQGVNTTNSAVQILHKPSGIIVKCQDERSQLKNKAKALKVLKARLLDVERERQEKAEASARRSMVSTGERSQKIRTYNYPQNRVTDHRIRLTLNKLDRIIEGDLDELVTALRTSYQAERLQDAGRGRRRAGARRRRTRRRAECAGPSVERDALIVGMTLVPGLCSRNQELRAVRGPRGAPRAANGRPSPRDRAAARGGAGARRGARGRGARATRSSCATASRSCASSGAPS